MARTRGKLFERKEGEENEIRKIQKFKKKYCIKMKRTQE